MTAVEGRRGAFKLRMYLSGRPYYAHVRVAVVARASEPRVALTLELHDRGSIRPGSEPECVRAALDGAAWGLDLAAGWGVPVDGLGIDILQAQMLLVDLTVSAFGAAATLAVTEAFGVLDRMGIVDDGGDCAARPVRVRDAGELVDRILREHADDDGLRSFVTGRHDGPTAPGPMAAHGVVVEVEGDDVVVGDGAHSERVSRLELVTALEARRRVMSGRLAH